MHDASGNVLYIGKAVNLRRRTGSYSTASALREPKIQMLVSQFESLLYIETASEIEALLVESRLIKSKMPLFNRLLTEPESCSYFRISREEPFPKVQIVPYCGQDTALYVGPVWRSSMAMAAEEAVTDLFKLRHCSGVLSGSSIRSCMYHELNRCSGPCIGGVSMEEYADRVDAAYRTLAGDSCEAVQRLTESLNGHIAALRYERARNVHEQIRALEYVSRSCVDSAVSDGVFAVVAPSYLPRRPVVLLFANKRLVWRLNAGPRTFPEPRTLADKLNRLKSLKSDILPGKPSCDDYRIVQSYLRQKRLTESILSISPEMPASESADSLHHMIGALRIGRHQSE